MARKAASRRHQRGAALIVFTTVLILGVAWFTVGALGKAAPTTASREIRTGQALQEGKRALLAYVTQYAARDDTTVPGRFPCPESPSLANPGEASAACSPTAIEVGRLPWKTLGIDQQRDGFGEPLWYMLRGFRDAPVNFGTAGQLTHNGAAVVALVIAPGSPLNTAADPGVPPAGCTKQNQTPATRNTGPLNPTNFIECGVALGSITSPGVAAWTNDRVVAITAAEWADAIAAAIGDRLQRQVAPAMYDFYSTISLQSWGQRFFPNASTFNVAAPETNNLCGNVNVFSGMPPTIDVATSRSTAICNTDWTGYSVSGLGALLSLGGCSVNATRLRCDFLVLLGGVASPRINATAPAVGYAFRRMNPATITIQVNGGPTVPASTGNYTGSVSAATGAGTSSVEVFFPLLSIADTVSIRVPHPTDALLEDTRSAWYVSNGWDRFTYYGAAQPATHDPAGICNPGGTITNCLTADGLPPSTPSNDKRLVLALMGRALPTQTRPSTNTADYLEDQNASVGVIYEVRAATTDFNDKVAACPFRYQDHAGANVVICN